MLVLDLFDDAGWVSRHDRERWNVLYDNAAGCDNGPLSNRHSLKHVTASPDPRPFADADGADILSARWQALNTRFHGDWMIIRIRDVALGRNKNIVFDYDAP